jgi:hypothetical protein
VSGVNEQVSRGSSVRSMLSCVSGSRPVSRGDVIAIRGSMATFAAT